MMPMTRQREWEVASLVALVGGREGGSRKGSISRPTWCGVVRCGRIWYGVVW